MNRPKGYLAVPHNDSLVEAVIALYQFGRSLDTRTPFRIRRRPRDFAEEVGLGNLFTGYAVLGLDIPSLYMDKGLVLPYEEPLNPNFDADKQTTSDIEGQLCDSPSFRYYATCVTERCAVADPLLGTGSLPRILSLAADLARRKEETKPRAISEFTVEEYLESSDGLIESSYSSQLAFNHSRL